MQFKTWKDKMLAKDSDAFVRVFGVLSGSTFLVQLIVLLVYPIISRLFTPAAFGERSLFVGMISLLVALSTLGYEISINVPKEQRIADQLVRAAILVVMLLSLFFTLLFSLFGEKILTNLGLGSIWYYRYWIWPAIFLGGSFQLLQHWLLRKEAYGLVARTKLWRNISKSGVELLSGFMGAFTPWLVFAWLLGNFSSAIRFLWIFIKKTQLNWRVSLSEIGKVLSGFSNFPKFQLASNFLRTCFVQAPIFILGYYYDTALVGQYTIAYAVFGVACAVMIDSFSNFHMVKLGQLLHQGDGGWRKYYQRMLLRTIGIGIFVALGMWLLGEWSVLFVFGATWEMAAAILPYLAIPFLSFFLYAFHFHIFTQLQKQYWHLLYNFWRLIILGLILWWSFDASWTVYQLLLIYGALDLCFNLVQTFHAYWILRFNFYHG